MGDGTCAQISRFYPRLASTLFAKIWEMELVHKFNSSITSITEFLFTPVLLNSCKVFCMCHFQSSIGII